MSFENRYFELIQMHRQNVNELHVGQSSGRKVFVDLIREFRCIHILVKDVAKRTNTQLDQHETFHVCYYVLLFGVGPNSSRMLQSSLASFGVAFLRCLDTVLSRDADKYRAKLRRDKAAESDQTESTASGSVKWTFSYVPFEGHLSRIGHYYRHLYQTVSYVHAQLIDIDKVNYTKMIRAQLSTHEQALLFINSLSPLGSKWITKGLIKEYELIHNIPQNFFDKESEICIDTMFGSRYFEWQEESVPEST